MLRHEKPPEKKEGSGFFSRVVRAMDGCEVEVAFKNKQDSDRICIDDPYDKTSERMHLFNSDYPVEGWVQLRPKGSYKHNGVTIELVGFVTTLTDREDKVEFFRSDKKFEPVSLNMATNLEFCFGEEKIYESYRGINAKVTYMLKVTVARPVKNVVVQEEVWLSKINHQMSKELPDSSVQRSYFRETEFGATAVSMEVGVDNVLHIEFKYDKKNFHLHERVLGLVTFKVMDLDLQYGEVGIVRKEYIGPGRPNDAVETETLQKFEIMDGTPIVGEKVPIRLYLNSIPRLTPSYPNIHNLFRVAYFVNLVLVTGEGKRYFKQQEIILYRRTDQETPANMSPNNN